MEQTINQATSSQTASLNTNSAISYNDPYFLSSNDNSNAQLGHIVFSGNNYVNWSRSVSLALGAKNKLGFVDGSLLRPGDESLDLQKWIRNDYMVTGWILNSIDKSIAESFIFTPSARDLWLEIRERYGHSNAPQLYEFHRTLMATTQNDDSIVEYYNKLKKVWDQLQVLEPLPDCTFGILVKCSCGFLKKLVKADQLKKLIQFVTGLNKSYDQAKINILSMDPLPSVNRVYHMLQQIERQNSIVNSQNVEISALMSVKNTISAANVINSRVPQGFSQKKEVKDGRKYKPDRFCDFCKMKGHLKESCFKLVGYPDWYKGKTVSQNTQNTNFKNFSQSKFAANVQESPLDISSQESEENNAILYKEFLKFMQTNHSNVSSTDSHSAINSAGNFLAFHASTSIFPSDKHVWIVNTGSSDHMANSLDVFSSIVQLDHPIHIVLPDGSIKEVYTSGSVVLNASITFSEVFYIPEFQHNLLSVAKLLDQNNLMAQFKNSSCSFKDVSTNSIKIVGIRHGGLYKILSDIHCTSSIPKHVISLACFVSASSSSSSSGVSDDVLHAIFGHMSIAKFKHLSGSIAIK